ncbi:MAG: methyltransferase domain-containing protein [Pirellulales bacterium]
MNVERAEPGTPQWAELAAPHLARYLFAAERVGGRRVLDLGSGAGYGAAVLRTAGAAAVLGVDADATAVARAQARHGGEEVSFTVGDCQELADVAGGWDVISCFEVIEHVPRPESLVAGAARRLAADGTFIVSTPDRAATPPFVAGRPRNRFHEHEWHRNEFTALLRRHFHDVDVRVQVETAAAQARRDAVEALRTGLMASNPLFVWVWRKCSCARRDARGWARLAGLAAPSITDFPIVPAAVADVYGSAWFTVAICRRPITGETH